MDALAEARSLRQQGRHDEALTAFARAVQEAATPLLAAQVRIGEIDSLGMLGRYDDAIALAGALEPQLPPRDAARMLGNLGSLYLRRDQYAEALVCYDKASALDADPRLHAGLAVNAGIALTYLGREAEAETRYTRAQELYATLGSAFEGAVVSTNLGFLSVTAGRYAQALSLLTEALQVFESEGAQHERARAAIDAGETCRALNLLPEARAHYGSAQAIFEQLPLDYDRARAALGQAAIFAQQDRAHDAEAALFHAEALFVAQGNAVQQAHVQLLRALLRQRQGREQEARTAAEAAQAGFLSAHLPSWAAEAQLVLGEGLEGVAELARNTGRVWLESRAERALGLQATDREAALVHFRRSVAALESLRAGISPEELHVAFLTDKEAIYSELASLLLSGSPTEAELAEALSVTERSRSRLLLERVLSATESLPDSPALEPLRAELSRAYRETLPQTPSEPQRHGIFTRDLSQLEAAYANALRQSELAHVLPGSTLQSPLPDIEALQAALTPEETLLVYGRFGESLGVFLLEREHLTAIPYLCSFTELQHAARRFRYHLQKMAAAPALRPLLAPALKTELDAVLAQLYDLVLRPLASQLKTARLILIPTGPLHGLPLAALHNGSSYLLDQHELILAPSAAIWHTLASRNRPSKLRTGPALLVGLPGVGTEQAHAEVAAIAPCLTHVTQLESEQATLASVCAESQGKAILHFATHALFRQDNPLFSCLQLADGWLLARDLYRLPLHADLVTLSACQTAVSQIAAGDEPFGLVRGFLAAGAQRVVASLWPADDAATAALMACFYQQLVEGKSPAGALRAAQQELRLRWPHPYYWAAFCLLGSG
ncbi:MAG: CHAT domain-containing tetratricopeptide repeat protein [Armatimonadetes bacterium]|nr:CHAT domain-containing tetratricopeptide repeat protein [Armatimonadota bacterium]